MVTTTKVMALAVVALLLLFAPTAKAQTLRMNRVRYVFSPSGEVFMLTRMTMTFTGPAYGWQIEESTDCKNWSLLPASYLVFVRSDARVFTQVVNYPRIDSGRRFYRLVRY